MAGEETQQDIVNPAGPVDNTVNAGVPMPENGGAAAAGPAAQVGQQNALQGQQQVVITQDMFNQMMGKIATLQAAAAAGQREGNAGKSDVKASTSTTINCTVPTLKPGMNYKEYERAVKIWSNASGLPKSRWAALLIHQLPEKDRYGSLKNHVIDHIGDDHLNEEDAFDKMMSKMKEFMQEHKFVRGVQWLGKLLNSKQGSKMELETYFQALEGMFKEGQDEFETEVHDFIKSCLLVHHCTSLSSETLGHIVQQVNIDEINKDDNKTLFEEIKAMMRKSKTAVNALKRPAIVNIAGMEENDLDESHDEKDYEAYLAMKRSKKEAEKKKSFRHDERKKEEMNDNCFTCGKPGHQSRSCPEKQERMERLKKKLLARGQVWDNKDGTWSHPNGETYTYPDPVHKGKKHYSSRLTSNAEFRENASYDHGKELEKRKAAAQRQKIKDKQAEKDSIDDLEKQWQEALVGISEAERKELEDGTELFDGDALLDFDDYDNNGTFMSVCHDVKINSVNITSCTPGHAIVDTGCQKTCASMDWIKEYIQNLPEKFKKMVRTKESSNSFRFGNPEVFYSKKYFLLPVKFGNHIKCLGVDGLDNDIPLLLSRENIKALGIGLFYPKGAENNFMTIGGSDEKIGMDNIHGHDWIDIMPGEDDWSANRKIDEVLINLSGADQSELVFVNGAKNSEKKYMKIHGQMAHPPKARMIEFLKKSGHWCDLSQAVVDKVYENCPAMDCKAREQCQKTKKVAWRDVNKLGDLVAVDLKISKGNEKDILYIVDVATSFVIARIIENKSTSHVTEKLYEAWYGNSFPPIKTLLSDNGTEFTGIVMEEFCEKMNIKHKCTIPYTPQMNGSCERIHAVVDANVSRLCQGDHSLSLRKALSAAVFAYNSCETKTGYTPAQLVFGQHAGVGGLLEMTPAQLSEKNDIPDSLAGQMRAREEALANHLSIKADQKFKEMLRRKTVPGKEHKPIGSWVYFKRSQEIEWKGPGKILAAADNEVVILMGNKPYRARQDDVILLGERELKEMGAAANNSDETEADVEQLSDGGSEDNSLPSPGTIGSDLEMSRSSEVDQISTQVTVDIEHSVSDVNNDQVGNITLRPAGLKSADSQVREQPEKNAGEVDSDATVMQEQNRVPDAETLEPDQRVDPIGAAGTMGAPDSSQPRPRGRPRKAVKEGGQSLVRQPPKFKRGHRIEFQDKDGCWKRATVLNRSTAATKAAGKEYYDVSTDNGQKKRVCLEEGQEGWSDLSAQEERERQAGAEGGGDSHQVLFSVDEGAHEVYVQQVPFHLHKTDEVQKSKIEQLQKINSFGTFKREKLSKLSAEQKKLIIPSTWAVVYKHVNGKRVVKSRLCARGDIEGRGKKEGVRTDCPTASKPALRTLLSLAATHGWKLKSLDFSAAFLQGKPIERELYIMPPKDIREKDPDLVWRVVKRIYGLKDASRGWYLELDRALKSLGCKVSLTDNSYYTWKDSAGNIKGLLCVHIDDILFCGEPTFHTAVIEQIKKNYVIGAVEEEHFTFTGWDLKQDKTGISLTQTSFVEKIDLSKFEKIKTLQLNKDVVMPDFYQSMYRSLVGMIGWCTSVSRPDKAASATMFSMKLGKATLTDARSALRVLKHIKESPQTIKFSNLGNIQDVKIVSWGDSSYGKFIPGQTISGVITFLQGGDKLNVLDWSSKKLEVPVGSPLAGEVEASLEAYGRIKWMRSLVSDSTGIQDISAEIITDSKSLLDALGNCNMVKDKRSLVGISTLRAIPEFDNTKISWIAGKLHLADHLTKIGTNADILREVLRTGIYNYRTTPAISLVDVGSV